MKTMNDFKGTPGLFEIRYLSGFEYQVVANGQVVLEIDGVYGDYATCEENEARHLADARLFANSKKVLEAAIGVCREFDDPNDSVEAFKKLEQAINDSL